MAKLPKEFDLAGVCGQKFGYQDAVEMIEDMKRFRRFTGWTVWGGPGANTASTFYFHFLDPETEVSSVIFMILVRVVHRTLWSSFYPGDPTIDELRQRFFERDGEGLVKIAKTVNEIPKDDPEQVSVWTHILQDDD